MGVSVATLLAEITANMTEFGSAELGLAGKRKSGRIRAVMPECIGSCATGGSLIPDSPTLLTLNDSQASQQRS